LVLTLTPTAATGTCCNCRLLLPPATATCCCLLCVCLFVSPGIERLLIRSPGYDVQQLLAGAKPSMNALLSGACMRVLVRH
jgi:hypothetical protein